MIRLRKPPLAALGPIAFLSLLVLLAAWFQARPRPETVSSWQGPIGGAPERPVAPGVPTPTAAPLAGDYLQAGSQIDLVAADGLFSEEEKLRLAAELDRALGYVVQRFGTAPRDRISTYVGLEPGCGINGIAYTDVRTVQVFTCRDLPISRAVNIMAHEFVHQLCHDRYGDDHLNADLILVEGTATWGAGAYWLGDAPNFRSFVRPWLEAGSEIPLSESYVGRPIADMNQLYYQWASFVEFLIETYGRDSFDQLYLTGAAAPASSDYQGVYQKSFEQLEAEWKAWVLS